MFVRSIGSHFRETFQAFFVSDLAHKFVIVRIFARPGKGYVSLQDQERDSALYRLLDVYGVPESERPALKEKIHIEISRVTRPLWVGRLERGGVLATLSAPSFLKQVHAEEIAPDGSVQSKIIRAIDPALMRAVAVYITIRKTRRLDLGDAAGLRFVLFRPSKRLPTKKQLDLLRRLHRVDRRARANREK